MNGRVPFGVADYFWDEARDRQSLLDQLMETLRGWGYGDVIPPMFEFDSTLSAQYDDRLRSGMYLLPRPRRAACFPFVRSSQRRSRVWWARGCTIGPCRSASATAAASSVTWNRKRAASASSGRWAGS